MLYFASILSGAIQCASPQFNAFWAIDFFMALSGIYWIKLDARHRNKPIPDIALFYAATIAAFFAVLTVLQR